ncbi:hypothetical protein ACFWB0_22090 [Rhodococcus sp. NPDC060086]|uniref:hypothetical protein n=1 Tax=Rhodococcus sp. NPDC060086 TaxID=3347055 RepID=UPI00365B8140
MLPRPIAVTELSHQLDNDANVGEVGPGWEYYLDILVAARDGTPQPTFDDYFSSMTGYFETCPPDPPSEGPRVLTGRHGMLLTGDELDGHRMTRFRTLSYLAVARHARMGRCAGRCPKPPPQ